MHKSNYKQIALAVCFAFLPFSAHSAGLGKLTVISGLGEPLRAEIDLVSTTPEELSSLSAAIAPQEAYAVQGMERRAIHSAIQIEVGKKPDGSPVLKLVTRQPVEDPFLDMLIQVDWATGRLLREYTVLLDPPGYDVEQPAISPAPVQTQAAAVPAPVAATVVAPAPVESSPPSTPAEKEYTTRSGDNLSKIARELQVEGVSLDQMLVGLYRANKDAFAGGNMNRLKVGQIIRAPSHEELAAVNPQEAAQEIKVQTADWNAYRNKLAAVVAESEPAAADAGDQAASGKLKTATEDKALPAESGPRDVVKLSKSEAEAAGAEAKALQDKLAAMQEENTARQKSVDEANERVAMLEKQIADLQALLTIKDKTLADLQEQPAATAEAEQVPAAAETPESTAKETPVLPAEAETPAEAAANATPPAEVAPESKPVPAKKPAAPAPAPVEESSFLDDLADNAPLIGLAGGAIVLLGGGWMFIRNRRKRNLDSFEQGILTAGGLKANTVFGNTSGGTVDTGDTSFLTNFSQNPSGMIDTHDVDPIAEAEVYMAYGRDSQAEEILNDAISKEPTRYELHLKLLEIFAARNDTSAFEAVAGELYSTLGSADPVWRQVAEMGQKLEPANPLYDTSNAQASPGAADAGKAAATAAVVAASAETSRLDASDFDSAELMSESSLDFSLDGESAVTEGAAGETGKTADDGLDFDLGFASTPAEASAEDGVQQAAPTGEEAAFADTVAPDAGGLDFNMDFSMGGEAVKAVDGEPTALGATESLAEDTIQFEAPSFGATLPEIEVPTLSFGDTQQTSDAAKEDEGLTLSSTTEFDLPSEAAAVVVEEPEQAPLEEASGLDFNFDLGAASEPEVSAPVEPDLRAAEQEASANAESALELDLSGITLDLGESAQAAEETGSAEQESEDVNTKLDLVTAYMDMGDNEGARELLEEVLKEGGPRQRQRAQELFASLS